MKRLSIIYALISCLGICSLARGQSALITTVAGDGGYGFSGDGGPATSASLGFTPNSFAGGVAVDVSENLFIADVGNHRIRRVSASGIITTVAGSGPGAPSGGGFSGDGGPATTARLGSPGGVAVDASGNLFIADTGNGRIRKVSASGIITTVAGGGTNGLGDGGPATSASLAPMGVAVDASGNIFIADSGNNRIRKVSASGIITTVAGHGPSCNSVCGSFSGDGGPATLAGLNFPTAVAVDASGDLFIADAANNRIREVSASGVITTVAGSGTTYGYSGDGGPATSALLFQPCGVAVDAAGDLFITDTFNGRLREVTTNRIITTVAGGGHSLPGAGGSPTSVSLGQLVGVALDTSGDIFTSDTSEILVREVLLSPGLVVTPAALNFHAQRGGRVPAQSQSIQIGGAAGTAWQATAVASTGGMWLSVLPGAGPIPSSFTARVNSAGLADGIYFGTITVNAPGVTPSSSVITVTLMVGTSIITTVAGGGGGGNGGLATAASLNEPFGLAVDASGNLFVGDIGELDGATPMVQKVSAANGIIAEVASLSYLGGGGVAVDVPGNLFFSEGSYVKKLSPSGNITTVAGNGSESFSGDGGPATLASLFSACCVAVDASGNLFISDTENSVIRKVSASGIITTIAGSGEVSGFSGDGGPATMALLNQPGGIAVDASGDLFVADNGRIRKISAAGIITTVAGGGINGLGDGGPATSAGLVSPHGVAVDASGNLFIADFGNNRIRRVSVDGFITTVAGSGTSGFSGDGGPATSALLNGPTGIALDASGNLFIADSGNNRIRKVSAVAVPIPYRRPPR